MINVWIHDSAHTVIQALHISSPDCPDLLQVRKFVNHLAILDD